MVFDFARVAPNPARDQKREIVPPTSEHVLAVHDILRSRYRLPLLVLDATGMRLGRLDQDDVGEHAFTVEPALGVLPDCCNQPGEGEQR